MTTRSTHIALPGHSPVTSTPDLRTAGHCTEVKPNTAGLSSDDESRNIPQTPAYSSPLILERAPHRNAMQSHEGLSSKLSKTIEAREGQNELMAQRPKKVLRGKSMKRIGVLKGRNTTPSTSLRQRKPGTRQPGEQASGINGSRLQQLFDLPQDSTPATQAASASRHAEHPLSSRRMCTGSAARTLRPATNSPSVNYQSVVPNFFVYNVAGSERREAQHLHVHNYRQAGNRCCERYQQGPMQYPPALSGVQDASTYITTVAAQNLAATPQGSTSTTHNVVYFQSQDVWHFTAYKEPTNYCSAIPAVQASAYIPSTAARDQSLARAVQAPVLYTVSDPNEFMFYITPPSANMHPNSVVPHDRNMPNMNSAQTRVCQGDQGFDSVPNGSSIPALRQSQSTHQDEKIQSRSHPS
ncbi:hypothetical protein BWQ96_10445 [Gracilariopsis chorda]|uniref:Uncharacterized protein n=1 Tax=Gracilariopsis chorda TaxID=448386 RepID=A0A2V3ICN0_9FLOR|nr:hypothetical protein BWQ96_10445 [Gracilariopsis chorda]|eukprot:PXF39849.1 hypothetical protein BWQ96_10445 [Gracilariopsis chorda]